jgi:hypothetical protein
VSTYGWGVRRLTRLSLLLTAFVGVNEWLHVAFGVCPASLILGKLFGLRSAYSACERPAP